jgi:alcohol dehydrogenase class IV
MPLINLRARIQFDFGASALLKQELTRLNVTRPLIVSDRGVSDSGVLDRVLAGLRSDMALIVFDQVAANPKLRDVEAALALFRDNRCDCVIAVGGGSPIDTGKCVALLATNSGTLPEYCGPPEAVRSIARPCAPLVAVPTTAGTGSEIGRGAGIEIARGQPKAVLRHDYLIPDVAICDPELTLTMPAWLTAGTGIDALSHCLEGYLSHAVNPPLDAIAIDGIVRIAEHLPRVIENGSNRESRWQVMMGAVEGGMCLVKGLGAAHALSIPIDTLDLHHGTIVGIVLPQALRFVSPNAGNKLDRLAAALGLNKGGDVADFLEDLNRRIGLPPNLSALGVLPDQVDDIAADASATSFNQTSARQGSSRDYAELLRSCL